MSIDAAIVMMSDESERLREEIHAIAARNDVSDDTLKLVMNLSTRRFLASRKNEHIAREYDLTSFIDTFTGGARDVIVALVKLAIRKAYIDSMLIKVAKSSISMSKIVSSLR